MKVDIHSSVDVQVGVFGQKVAELTLYLETGAICTNICLGYVYVDSSI